MKRSPLRRKTPLKASDEGLKRTQLSPVSKKRQGEAEERRVVRQIVFARDGHRCAAKGLPNAKGEPFSCYGRLEIDEIVSRARRPGGHLDPDNCQVLCSFHNTYKEDQPDWAIKHGLAKNSWEAS